MIDELLLLSGNDIPFPIARLTIHQPRLKEIAYVTQDKFWHGCQLLKFDKNSLDEQVKNVLANQSNFNILMSMIMENSLQARQARVNLLSIVSLIFPTSKIQLDKNVIRLSDEDELRQINENNFQQFKSILLKIFCLAEHEQEKFNPSGDLAKKIADKIKEGQRKRARQRGSFSSSKKISILSRYVSILTVGEQKNINDFMNYTVYQLMDEFKRFQLKMKYDAWQRYRIAGATGLEDPEDWFKDIYSVDENKKQDQLKTIYAK